MLFCILIMSFHYKDKTYSVCCCSRSNNATKNPSVRSISGLAYIGINTLFTDVPILWATEIFPFFRKFKWLHQFLIRIWTDLNIFQVLVEWPKAIFLSIIFIKFPTLIRFDSFYFGFFLFAHIYETSYLFILFDVDVHVE